MFFWLLCALLTVAVTVVTLRPLMLRGGSGNALPSDNADLQVYKEQLAEVDRDISRGLLSGEEAKAARIEISRRILAAAPAQVVGAETSPPRPLKTFYSGLVFYLIAGIIVTSSVGLYLMRGSPGLGGQPHAERAGRTATSAPVHELVARVEARLREVPSDGRGWDVLAPVYLKQQRYTDAIAAFEKAIEMLGENRPRLRGLAEAHLAATNGIVSEVVRNAYRKILAKEPNLIAPRFWLAVGLEQDGDRAAAKSAYMALLQTADGKPATDLPPALEQLIRERLAVVGGSQNDAQKPSKGDGQTTGPAGSERMPGAGTEVGKGPPPSAGMGAQMTTEQRAAMIEGMVSGLAERLNADGGSEQEWLRLIRAYTVLERRQLAADALAKAKQQFAGEPEVGKRLDAFARELGIPPG
jgi:cytochrome c-type biogenesis protein CcmH